MRADPTARTVDAGLAPFAGAAVLAWGLVIIGSSVDWIQYAASIGLLLLSGALTVAARRGVRRIWIGAVPSSLLFLAAVGLLRNSAGGISTGAGGLSLIAVFGTALYTRSRRQLVCVLAGVAVFYLAPIILVGAPSYPDSQYRAALLSVFVSSIIGLATQRLVADVRHQAGQARSRERMLEQVGSVVRGLLGSSQARKDVCEAAKTISDARSAVLYEPGPESAGLRCTATAGIDMPATDIAAGTHNALTEAFRSGSPRLITDNIEAELEGRELYEASGCPESVLFQPLLHGGRPLGVLVVGWSAAVPVDGPRATVVALLAHEAAAAIERADALDLLTDMAETDPLTGLSNRRAWDAHLRQAVGDQRQFTIAILDLDHFKEFNDTHGHPAGDRLLVHTTAAWREQLRAGDLLARTGGEEFALLLLDTDRETALRVIDRLRQNVSEDRTCSAGIAIRIADEPSESVIARADRALYRAKESGRDRALVSA
jgi:diguanylate cyclase (GGDEF)-like protein